MNLKLQSRFEAIESQRMALQSCVSTLTEAQVNWTPSADTWSVGQIVQHLVLSDETLGQARDVNVVEPEALMFRVLPRAVRRALILTALRRDTVLPLPSPAVEPQGTISLSELLPRWDLARGEMRRGLDALHGNERRYFHPVLGPLAAAQMLELGQTHTAYHTRQIDKLQNDTRFPRYG